MSELDLGRLLRFGITKGIEHIEKQAGFPMQESLQPLVSHGMSKLKIPETVEIDPVIEGIGRLIISSLKKQEEARRINASQQQTGNG